MIDAGKSREALGKDAAVVGAVDFVRSLPWTCLVPSLLQVRRAGLTVTCSISVSDSFGPHVYSGREHVERGKPSQTFISTRRRR